MHWIRDRYNLPILQQAREYEIVPETAYGGKQAQVDFGEYTMRTSTDSRIKVFFFSMMLARSRYKYLWFTIRNFTTDLAVFAHEKAFEFFDGIPEEIVYDQDKVFLVSENKGENTKQKVAKKKHTKTSRSFKEVVNQTMMDLQKSKKNVASFFL